MSLNYLLRLKNISEINEEGKKNLFILFFSPQKGTLGPLMLQQRDIFHIGLLLLSNRGR